MNNGVFILNKNEIINIIIGLGGGNNEYSNIDGFGGTTSFGDKLSAAGGGGVKNNGYVFSIINI